jgi:hypothetical protein
VKFYECQFAPAAATRRDAIRVGQVVHDRGVSAYEAFAPRAFAGWGKAEIRVLIDHCMAKRAGTVKLVAAHRDWFLATFVLDGPYAALGAKLIARSGKVSLGATVLDQDPVLADPIPPTHNPTHWYTRARLDEISVVSPPRLRGTPALGSPPFATHDRPPPAPPAKTTADPLVRRPRSHAARPYSAVPVGEVFETLGPGVIRLERTGEVIRLGRGRLMASRTITVNVIGDSRSLARSVTNCPNRCPTDRTSYDPT